MSRLLTGNSHFLRAASIFVNDGFSALGSLDVFVLGLSSELDELVFDIHVRRVRIDADVEMGGKGGKLSREMHR